MMDVCGGGLCCFWDVCVCVVVVLCVGGFDVVVCVCVCDFVYGVCWRVC